MIFSRKLWMVVTVILSTLLVVVIMASTAAFTYEKQVHDALGTLPFKQIDNPNAGDANYFPAEYTDESKLNEDFAIACENVEAEGLVLMRNDNDFLPLNSDAGVNLFGMGSTFFNCSEQGGRTSGDKDKFTTLKEAIEGTGVTVNPDLWDFYTSDTISSSYGGNKRSINDVMTYTINEVPLSVYPNDLRGTYANYDDAAIVTITRDGGEGSDLNAAGSDGKNGNYLSLSEQERALLKDLTMRSEVNGGPIKGIVVLINSAYPIELDFLYDTDITIDACIWVGNVGSSGIYAVADALIGEVVPSGRLSDIYCKNNFSSPSMASWSFNDGKIFSQKYDNRDGLSNATQANYGVYVEGIYVGYRYYETRYYDAVTDRTGNGNYDYFADVAYSFGSGLSYAEFEYDNYIVTENTDSFLITIDVNNVSDDTDGKEVVQIYAQKPYTDYAVQNKMEVSAVELVGFAKTDIIKAGESGSVEITVEKSQLKSYDANGKGTYILEEDNYYLAAGKNAHDALNNILNYQGYTESDGMDYDGNKDFVFEWKGTNQTLSKSDETGNIITNQLDFADMNKYSGRGNNSVTYVSRNDWAGTFPSAAIRFTATEQMKSDLNGIPEPDDAGYEKPKYGATHGLTLAMLRNTEEEIIPYDDIRWSNLLDQMSFDEQNSLIVKGYVSTEFISSVQKPQTSGTDSPTAIRAGQRRFPCEGIWAATFNIDLAGQIGDFLANDARFHNADAMWIPGMNMHRTPYGGRAHEYFSEDPFLTGKMAEYEIKSIQSKGVIAYPKHYIFNESEVNRNGIGIWLSEQAAREIYLEPWKYAASMQRGNAHALMSSFNRAGCKWTSADVGLITNILRNEFGFDGFILTDMAEGNAASVMKILDGVMAGTDLWFSSSMQTHTLAPYKDNAAVCQKMREASHRILYNVCNYSAAMNGWSADTRAVLSLAWWQISLIAAIIALGVLTAAGIAMYVLSYRKEVIDSKKLKL